MGSVKIGYRLLQIVRYEYEVKNADDATNSAQQVKDRANDTPRRWRREYDAN